MIDSRLLLRQNLYSNWKSFLHSILLHLLLSPWKLQEEEPLQLLLFFWMRNLISNFFHPPLLLLETEMILFFRSLLSLSRSPSFLIVATTATTTTCWLDSYFSLEEKGEDSSVWVVMVVDVEFLRFCFSLNIKSCNFLRLFYRLDLGCSNVLPSATSSSTFLTAVVAACHDGMEKLGFVPSSSFFHLHFHLIFHASVACVGMQGHAEVVTSSL